MTTPSSTAPCTGVAPGEPMPPCTNGPRRKMQATPSSALHLLLLAPRPQSIDPKRIAMCQQSCTVSIDYILCLRPFPPHTVRNTTRLNSTGSELQLLRHVRLSGVGKGTPVRPNAPHMGSSKVQDASQRGGSQQGMAGGGWGRVRG